MIPTNTLFYTGDLSGLSGNSLNLNTIFTPPDPNTEARVYAPVIVPGTKSWTVTGIFSYGIYASVNPPVVTQASYEIRTGVSPGNGGNLIASGILPTTPVPSGRSVVNYIEYLFEVSIPEIVFIPGITYWFSVTPITTVQNISDKAIYNSKTLGANSIGSQSSDSFFQNGIVGGTPINFQSLGYSTSNGVIGRVNGVVCVHPDTRVLTTNGMMPIKNIKKGMKVIDYEGKPQEIIYNIFFPTKVGKFVKIPANSLGARMPKKDLFIRPEHPILFKGERILPLDLAKKLNLNEIKEVNKKMCTTYTLCTKEKGYVNMEGLMVATWSYSNWLKHAESTKLLWKHQ